MGFNKEDKKLRLKVEAFAVLALILFMLLVFGITANKHNKKIVIDSDEQAGVVLNTTEDLNNSDSVSSGNNVTSEASNNGASIYMNEDKLNEYIEEIAKSDEYSYELVNNILDTTGLSEYFDPAYATNRVITTYDEELKYLYKYNVTSYTDGNEYDRLDVTIEYGLDENDISNMYFTFVCNSSSDETLYWTIKAKMAQALGDIFEADMGLISTSTDSVNFEYNGCNYTLSNAEYNVEDNDHLALCYVLNRVDEYDNSYKNHTDEVDNKIDLSNITMTNGIKTSDYSIAEDIKNLANLTGDVEISYASSDESYGISTENIIYNIGDNTVYLDYSKDKVSDTANNSIRLVTNNKTTDELKEIAVAIANKYFDVNLDNPSYEDSDSYCKYKDKEVDITIQDNMLQISNVNMYSQSIELDHEEYMKLLETTVEETTEATESEAEATEEVEESTTNQ